MTAAPTTLGDAGSLLWGSITSKGYVLRPDELARLEGACRTADMIASLEEVWIEQGCPTVTTGSMGQEVIHPLIGELRQQRAALDGALIRLKLPDEAGEAVPAESASDKARRAAQARWNRGA